MFERIVSLFRRHFLKLSRLPRGSVTQQWYPQATGQKKCVLVVYLSGPPNEALQLWRPLVGTSLSENIGSDEASHIAELIYRHPSSAPLKEVGGEVTFLACDRAGQAALCDACLARFSECPKPVETDWLVLP